jgi:hypothetical protein
LSDVLLTQGKLSDALQAYRESLSIAERLAKADFEFVLNLKTAKATAFLELWKLPRSRNRDAVCCTCSGLLVALLGH